MGYKEWKAGKQQERELTDKEVTALRRAKMLSTSELIPWVDQCLFLQGRALSEYQKQPKPEYLEEALGAAHISVVLISELQNRAEKLT